MSTLILLHGAIGSVRQFDSISNELKNSFNIHALNFHGHGGEPFPENEFSIPLFAEQAAAYIDKLQPAAPVYIFGYSMGGYVAMYMARHLKVNIARIITLGTKFHWDEPTAEKETKMLQPDLIEQKVPAFAQQLQERHRPQPWKQLLHKTNDMLLQMGKNNPLQLTDYANISTPALIMLGDRDNMVTREETFAVYQQLPNAQLAILPGTPHPVEKADGKLVAFMVKRFLN